MINPIFYEQNPWQIALGKCYNSMYLMTIIKPMFLRKLQGNPNYDVVIQAVALHYKPIFLWTKFAGKLPNVQRRQELGMNLGTERAIIFLHVVQLTPLVAPWR